MALEDLTGPSKFVTNLDPTNPVFDDWLDEGDDHDRGVKNVLRNTFPRANADVFAAYMVGMIGAFIVVPQRWIPMDGRTISRTNYPLLFAALGIAAGTTTWVVPDTRGLFLRGLDSGRGYDPSRVIASEQNSGFPNHYHAINDPTHAHASSSGGNFARWGGGANVNGNPGVAIDDGGGGTTYMPTGVSVVDVTTVAGNVPVLNGATAENRPRNLAVIYAIFADQ